MKKLAMLLLCGGLLVACSHSSYGVKVSDANDTLISGSNVKITKQDYFETLLDQSGARSILNQTLLAIADKELTDTSGLDSLVEKKKETYAKYSTDGLEGLAKNAGYDSVDDYVNDNIVPEAKQELLRKKYIQDHFDDLLKEYQVCRFKKIVVDKESTALSLIKEATSEDAFNQLMDKNKDQSEDADIVTKNSTLDDNLKAKLQEFSQITEDGVYKEAIKLSDDSYAVVYIYDTAHKDQQEWIDTLSSDANIQEEINGIYLKKYHFTVNDKNLKEQIQKISDQYIE